MSETNGAWLRFGLRQTWRDARAGDLRLLALAVVIAVAAITSVGFLADRVSRALDRDAVRLLGADLVLESPQEAPKAWVDQARSRGLSAVRVWQFPSMVGASQADWHLASIKAVEEGYPLRGQLRTSDSLSTPDVATDSTPQPGYVWVDPQLLGLTGLALGQTLQVGHQDLVIERILTYEPDRGMQFVNMAPRVLMHEQDLPATGLLTQGSRVGHTLLIAGEEQPIGQFRRWLEPQLDPAQKILDVQQGRPEIRRTVERAEQFLTLVVMIAVLIAAVAIALGAHRFGQRQQRTVAVMRCVGATRAMVRRVLLVEFFCVALVGTGLGLALGWLVQMGLVHLMREFVEQSLPGAGFEPVLQGIYAGFWLLFAFSWPPLQSLVRISPAQIFRRAVPVLAWHSAFGYVMAIGGFAVLMWWIAGDLVYGAGLAFGFVVASLLFGVCTLGAIRLVATLRNRVKGHVSWRFAMAGLVRRRGATVMQVSALAAGMMAILLLLIVRTDLLEGWQQTLPPDAPNRFLINIQPDQVAGVEQSLRQVSATQPVFYPMVRGRFVEHNGKAVKVDDFDSPRVQRLLQRDFNLTYMDALDEKDQQLEGQVWDPLKPEVSMESSIAQDLGLSLGDEVVFEVAGQAVPARVTSLRKVDWAQMKPNFFAILTPFSLKDAPQTFMTAVYLPAEKAALIQDLVRQYPNLTVFDMGAVMAQLQSVLNRVVVAIQGLFVFAVMAGAIVLMAALGASRDERVREAALLRAMGATRRQLRSSQRLELLGIGALAGLMASAGATLVAWGLSRWVFQFQMVWSVTPWLIGLVFCMLAAWLAGSLALRGVLSTPPLLILRNE